MTDDIGVINILLITICILMADDITIINTLANDFTFLCIHMTEDISFINIPAYYYLYSND